MESKIEILNIKIESQIKESKDSLSVTELYSEDQWGNLAVALARTYPENSPGEIFYTLKACHHYCNSDKIKKENGMDPDSLEIVLDNLESSKISIEGAISDGIAKEKIIGKFKADNWERWFTSISLYDNSDVQNKLAKIRTLLY